MVMSEVSENESRAVQKSIIDNFLTARVWAYSILWQCTNSHELLLFKHVLSFYLEYIAQITFLQTIELSKLGFYPESALLNFTRHFLHWCVL